MKLLSIQLAPVHLSTGMGPTGTFNADGALDDFEPWTGLHQPPHQPDNYYKDVLKGVCLVADECSRDVIFE